MTRTTTSAKSREAGAVAYLKKVPAALGFITLAAGVVSAVLAALWTAYPGLRPDPGERAEAAIRTLAVDLDVTQAAYFQRLGATPPKCTRDELHRRGNVFYIEVDASGFKRSSVGIRWFTYDAGNDQRLRGLRSNNRETTVFRPSAPINRQIAQVWVPWATTNGDYYVRFELYSGNVLRAFVDSKRFSVPPLHPGEYKGPWCKPLATRH